MDCPAEILDGLIDAQTVLPSLLGPEAVMRDFQTAQHPHAAFSQRVAPHLLGAQEGGHPHEVLVQKLGHFLKRLWLLPVNRQPLQGSPRLG